MSPRFGPITVALTGQLANILILSAILALTSSYLILRLYRRAVIKSMRRRGQSDLLDPKGFLPPEPEHKPHDAPICFKLITRESLKINPPAAALYHRAIRRRWGIAVINAIAGCTFAVTMATAFLSAAKIDLSFSRLLFFAWIYAWPMVLAIDLAVGLSRHGRIIAIAAYFLPGAMVISNLLAIHADLSLGQLLYWWLGANVPATLLLLLLLHRHIRAVGPPVLFFMVVSVGGAILMSFFVGSNHMLLHALGNLSSSLGLGRAGPVIMVHILGFALFAIAAWVILGTLRHLYQNKIISEQSITIDAVWLLFGIVNSLTLVSQGRWWILSGLTAYVNYRLIAVSLFLVFGIAPRSQLSGRRLLLLRVFALDRRSEALYDTLGKLWRTVGSMQVIAGSEQAKTTIAPHEFLDFVAGKLDRRFIDSWLTLDVLFGRMDLQPDKEGQFRVTEFFCHDDTWKMALARLTQDSDAVLMDLRSLSQANSASVAAIHELFNAVAVARIVFVVNNRTDEAYLRQNMQEAWHQLKQRSPNFTSPAGQVSLVDLSGLSRAGFRNLLYAICAAATAKSA